MRIKGQSILVYIMLISGALLLFPLGSLLSANIGQALYLSYGLHGRHPRFAPRMAARLFDIALWLNPRNASARAGQGFVLLDTGREDEALAALLASLSADATDPFVYSAALRLFYRRGESAQALALLTASPPQQMSLELADYMALVYLQQGDSSAWDQALSLRPGDLYAHYQLWERAVASQDQSGANRHHQALQQFPRSALYPHAPELAQREWSVLPALYARGLWSPALTARVLANLVWQQPASPTLERALQDLAHDHPLEPHWATLLGELYERRGALDLAVDAYRQALRRAPSHTPTRLRLALALARRASSPWAVEGDRQAAYGLLTEYHRLAPRDPQALRVLLAIAHQVDPSAAPALQRRLEALIDPRLQVAPLLGLPAESLDVGPNLLANPGFETWAPGSDPYAWESLDISHYEFAGPALFIVGAEPHALDGSRSARIDTLWLGQAPGKSQPRAGLWASNPALAQVADFPLERAHHYLVTIEYRSEGAGVSLSFGSSPHILPVGEQIFPQTDGQARIASLVLRATSDARLSLLICQVGEGILTVDNVSLYRVIPLRPGGS